MKKNPSIAALTLLGTLCATGLAQAQVAGATTSANLGISETTQLATGAQVQDQSGRLVIPGAIKDMVKATPAFDYAYDTTQRDKFVAAAEQDIAKGRTRVTDLEKSTEALSADAKGKVDQQLTALRGDVKVAETKLGELKQATANRWKEFEAGVSAATARLRKAIDIATG
jgi:hypothetical protein